MLRGIILRLLSGLLVAGILRLVGGVFPNIEFIRVENFIPTTLTIVGFFVGVYAMPIIASLIRKAMNEFTEHVTKQVVSSVRLQMEKINDQKKKRSKDVKKKSAEYFNPIVVDTSALIDGRIKDVAETGFLSSTLLVPKFVLSELQHIADSPEALRRGKGRRGLDILNDLKKMRKMGVEVKIVDNSAPGAKDIDGKILEIAKSFKAKVITVDFNLNKVANASNIQVLNVNELSNAIKAALVPGDEITIKVVAVGKESTQGVGYLEDGTMIVVENGAHNVGKTIVVVVSRFLQTAAGRMIFAQVK